MIKNLPASAEDARDTGSIFGSGRSPGVGNATHCNILAWKTPWTEEAGVSWSCKESDKTEHVHTHTQVLLNVAMITQEVRGSSE